MGHQFPLVLTQFQLCILINPFGQTASMEVRFKKNMANSNNDVDINVLIGLYNQKLASVSNQNVLLEAKIQTITQDFLEEKTKLLEDISELQKKYDILASNIDEEE